MVLNRVLLNLTLLLMLLAACTAPPEEDLPSNRIIYGLSIEVSGIDPHINQSAELGIVLRQVYDTLVYRHPETSEIVPGLASEWEISDDGLVYTFRLREGVVFHDGTSLNARAVADNLERIFDPATLSQRARSILGPLDRYEIVDDYTIRLILSEPYGALLDAFSQIYTAIASPEAFKAYSLVRYQYHQVGTGPFEFIEYLPGDRIVIRRNPVYDWGPDFYSPPTENSLQEVEFRFYRDPATRSLALENDEAQIMGELMPSDARSLVGNSSVQLMPVEIPGQPLQFYMNVNQPPTDNLAVRQALIYAANRSSIVDSVYQGFSPIAWGPLSAATPYYTRGVEGAYDHDVDQARALLASVGYQDTDDDGYYDVSGEPLTVAVVVPPWGLVPEAAQLLQDQWREAGIRAVLDPVPGFLALKERVDAGAYNLVSFDAFSTDPTVLNTRFLSNGIDNWTGYADPALDNVLLNASRQVSAAERRDLYAQAQIMIMQQALILPVRDYVNLNGHAPRIQGLTFEPMGWFPLLNNVTIAGARG